MTQNDVIPVIRQIIGWIGVALAVIALAKFAGVNIPLNGDTQTTALVAIACMMVR